MDRNLKSKSGLNVKHESLSARRAWIEIRRNVPLWLLSAKVALRKESVDRNIVLKVLVCKLFQSLSARRAWIEIFGCPASHCLVPRRSPQGERG